tara:strand:+ start:914 stop:1066 length:153 start_codon:yes stop_codon:yes gene_type:complete
MFVAGKTEAQIVATLSRTKKRATLSPAKGTKVVTIADVKSAVKRVAKMVN